MSKFQPSGTRKYTVTPGKHCSISGQIIGPVFQKSTDVLMIISMITPRCTCAARGQVIALGLDKARIFEKGRRNGVIGCRPTSYIFYLTIWCR